MEKTFKNNSSEGGGWSFKKHPKIRIFYMLVFIQESLFLEKVITMEVFKNIEWFGESSSFIEFDQYGQLWVAHPSKGYYRLRILY